MRVLYHRNIGAVFVDRFAPDATALLKRSRGGMSNWRAWFFGRWRIMVVRATPTWHSS